MLGHAGDDMVALFAIHLDHALERQIVRFGGSAGKDQLLGVGMDQPGDLLPCGLDRFLGLPSESMVSAGRIAELFHEVGEHSLQDPGVHRGRRVIVQVQRKLHRSTPSAAVSDCTVINGVPPIMSSMVMLFNN